MTCVHDSLTHGRQFHFQMEFALQTSTSTCPVDCAALFMSLMISLFKSCHRCGQIIRSAQDSSFAIEIGPIHIGETNLPQSDLVWPRILISQSQFLIDEPTFPKIHQFRCNNILYNNLTKLSKIYQTHFWIVLTPLNSISNSTNLLEYPKCTCVQNQLWKLCMLAHKLEVSELDTTKLCQQVYNFILALTCFISIMDETLITLLFTRINSTHSPDVFITEFILTTRCSFMCLFVSCKTTLSKAFMNTTTCINLAR